MQRLGKLAECDPFQWWHEYGFGETNLPTGKAVVDVTFAEHQQKFWVWVWVVSLQVIGDVVLGDGTRGTVLRCKMTSCIDQTLATGVEGQKRHREVVRGLRLEFRQIKTVIPATIWMVNSDRLDGGDSSTPTNQLSQPVVVQLLCADANSYIGWNVLQRLQFGTEVILPMRYNSVVLVR